MFPIKNLKPLYMDCMQISMQTVTNLSLISGNAYTDRSLIS
jgi:hypothetical protein